MTTFRCRSLRPRQRSSSAAVSFRQDCVTYLEGHQTYEGVLCTPRTMQSGRGVSGHRCQERACQTAPVKAEPWQMCVRGV